MSADRDGGSDPGDRLKAIRSAESLADLRTVMGVESEHEAYFEAKREWASLRGGELAGEVERSEGLPGNRVAVDGRDFWVHGITHADTPEEGDFLCERVSGYLDRGATVYCEQGIRSMYFRDFASVCEMDDYRWAMERCREIEAETRLDGVPRSAFDGLLEDLDSMAAGFRESAFELIESGRPVYGERFASALGDLASTFLRSHEDFATAEDFRSFRLSRDAARNPDLLADLQRYYETAFLPQPLEREWLRRHDPELEVLTHARNERMAEYALSHNEDATEVHLIVGAAHGPGVTYYLEQYDGGPVGFEPVE